MTALTYYQILSVDPGASLQEIKHAYRQIAKRCHPDLFPESERARRELRMMRINEAYMGLLWEREREAGAGEGSRRGEPPPDGVAPVAKEQDSRAPASEARALGPLKDPAYTYYKLGFRYFSEGRRTFLQRYVASEQRIDFTTESLDVLRLAVVSLHYFHRAYACFLTVARDYPTSLWARDAEVKIYYLNRFNVIYQRICDNLSRQLKEHRQAPQA